MHKLKDGLITLALFGDIGTKSKMTRAYPMVARNSKLCKLYN